jgi:hypothetical protein
MATERRYALENRGRYVQENAGWYPNYVPLTTDLDLARTYQTIHGAYMAAQGFVHRDDMSNGTYHAVPVERETERTVLQTDENPRFIMWHPTRSPAAERAIHNATLFTAEDLLGMDDSWSEYKIIPVEVTEAPGPWRVVESEAE